MEQRDSQLNEEKYSFSDAEKLVVKTALKTKLFKKDESVEVRNPKWQKLVTDLSEAFGIPEVKFVHVNDDTPGSGQFVTHSNTIELGRYSLVTMLTCFAQAVFFHKNPELFGPNATEDTVPEFEINPLAFALSYFKACAPIMFETAKNAGRLVGVAVPYTDGGRIRAEAPADEPQEYQMPDIDPENRPDRGNGRGED